MTILVSEPREIEPVQLILFIQSQYPGLRYKHFAIAFGVSQSTIDKWMAGYKRPSKSNRILAAKLAEEWGVTA